MRRAGWAVLVAAGTLAGCQYPSAQKVAMLNQAIGRDEASLVREFGVPTKTYETGGTKFLSYQESWVEQLPGVPGPVFYGYGGFGYGWGGPGYLYAPTYSGGSVRRDCDTTFEVVGGIVKSWKLRGNDCG
jgi:hypothetical protein